MNNETKLAKNTILLSFGTMFSKGIMFIMVPLFSRWLSVEAFGQFDLFSTYITLLIPFIGLASGEAVFRFSADTEEQNVIRKNVSNGLCIHVIICLMVTVALFVIFQYRYKEYCFAFIVFLIAEVLNNYLLFFLRSIKKIRIYAVSSVLVAAFTAIFVTVMIKECKMGLNGLLYGYTIGYMAGNIMIIISARFSTFCSYRTLSWNTMKELVRYSYPLIPNNISWWVMNASDRYIINAVLGLTSNGIYSIAYKVPSLCSSIFSMYSISWQQAAVESAELKVRNNYYNESFNIMLCVMSSLCIGLLSINWFMYNVVFDARYYFAYKLTPILVLSIMFTSITQFVGGINIGLKMPKENGITTIIGAVSNILIHLILIRVIGLYAAAIANLMANAIIVIVRTSRLRSYVNLSINRRSIVCLCSLAYFFVFAYAIKNGMMNILNSVAAGICFLLINYPILKKIIKSYRRSNRV
jgi:O-antigen/teichoic acid export membrane protein